MTKQEAVDKMKDIQSCGDIEIAHSRADILLCDVLEELGYRELVDEFDKVEKWYA